MTPQCKGEMHGHDFVVANGNCLNCGISQVELSHPKPKPIAMPKHEPKPLPKGVHTEVHDLAFQFWTYYGKQEKFGLFLGLVTRRGKLWAYAMLSEIKDFEKRKQGQKYPIQYLMAKKG